MGFPELGTVVFGTGGKFATHCILGGADVLVYVVDVKRAERGRGGHCAVGGVVGEGVIAALWYVLLLVGTGDPRYGGKGASKGCFEEKETTAVWDEWRT